MQHAPIPSSLVSDILVVSRSTQALEVILNAGNNSGKDVIILVSGYQDKEEMSWTFIYGSVFGLTERPLLSTDGTEPGAAVHFPTHNGGSVKRTVTVPHY